MEDSTEIDQREMMPESRDAAGEDDGGAAGEWKALRLYRGRKAAMFTRACNTAEAQIARRASEEELKKRLETLNTTLDGFMEANDEYVEKLQDVSELREAEEYATRLTARHAETVARVEEAIAHPSVSRSASRAEMRPAPPASFQERSRLSESHVSRGSRASVASKEAEITAEMKALELKHLKAKKERERQMRRTEEERREQEDVLEEKALEEEVERALVRARLCRAAENELDWERRHDFDDVEAVAEVAPPLRGASKGAHQTSGRKPASCSSGEAQRRLHQPEAAAMGPAEVYAGRNDGPHPANWVTALGSERPCGPHGPSAFVKSIPRLTLPTFRGSPQEWPRWIGLFKALVHDQPSLSDSERMAHLQNAVEGPAAQAIDGMLFNGNLYGEALRTLQERFGREEDIIQAHLRKTFTTNPPALTDLSAMEKFYAIVHNTVTVLQNLGYSSDLSSSENLRRVVEKLPNELAREWGREVFRLRPARPTLATFSAWLQVQVSILSFSAAQSGTSERKRAAAPPREGAVRRTALVTGATCEAGAEEPRSPPLCRVCGDKHKIADCPSFKAKTLEARMEVVYGEGLCFSCLRKGHWTRRCRSARRCDVRGCKLFHHPLLHRGSEHPKHDQGGSREEDPSRESSTVTARHSQAEGSGHRPFVAAAVKSGTETLLQIVSVRVHGGNRYKDVLALLDAGAQTSLCSEDVLKELEVTGRRHPLCIQNVETSGAQRYSEKVQLTLSALGAEAKKEHINISEVWSVPSLNVTAGAVTKSQLHDCQHLRGLDFPQYNGGQVKLLIGANVLEAVLQKEVRVGRPSQPAAVKTDLGWTLTGSVSAVVPSSMRHVMFLRRQTSDEEDELSAAVSEWWSTEAFGTKYCETTSRSKEDQRALMQLEENTKRIEGRYRTGLLWRENNPTFPNNKQQAMQRLQATERKLQKHPEVAAKYKDTIEAYIAEGHARKLTSQEAAAANDRRWFLPHHAVTNPNKPGKVRVVFDAAAVYRGVSLNEKLLTGPDLLQNLPGVLLRFREGPVAIAADIKQMYHQIEITEEDQPTISFLWRDLDTSRPPDTYQMQVLIFGARSSPAIANYVLRRTLEDHWIEEAAVLGKNVEQIQQCFYMDDFLLSDTNVDTARQLKEEVTRVVAEGGFQLTKWRSNQREVLEGTSTSDTANPDGALCLGTPTAAAEKALGVVWDENEDTLGFRLREASSPPLTKRGVLSQTASIFDPLGIAAPFTVKARILMQQLWTRQLSWDEPLPEPELSQWIVWLHESDSLLNISVPRCVRPGADLKSQELHVFCDASEAAFGAVIYLRSTTDSNVHQCRFLIAKTRVAPLKKLSIVRLELQAALLGARLATTVVAELSRKPDAVFYWSDSSVVLQYLANESRRFHTFVANRVAEVKELTAGGTWRHVPGKLNPADDCSRGLPASELTLESRWLSGPAFLCLSQENWPAHETPQPLSDDAEEVKPNILVSAVGGTCQPEPDPSKYSSWLKFRRVVAWVRRFAYNASERSKRRSGPLSSEELKDAETVILRQTQQATYPEETGTLALGHELPTRSSLLPLSPYRDEDGLMRVGGRLGNAPVPEDARHPVILPRHGEVTRLVIMHEHVGCGHAGVEHTLNELRQKYWVLRGRTAVKQLLQKCPTCRRRRALPRPPRMASLPAERFDTARPFSSTGIDMFGPLYVKRFRRTEKRYGLLATCMATRAIHLEVVHSLDTDSCIMALRRFFARRGRPSTIRSDNGTNFVGSCRELRAELRAMEKHIAEKLSAFEVDWRFNPPAASHMGGVWERMVRSVKSTLKVVVGRQTLTDEVLVTVLAEVEHMVNSRPLTHVSSEPTDPEALTPNHFLLSGASRHIAPGLSRDQDLSSRRRWKQAQAVAEHVWRRWTKEYIPTLIKRSKWRQEQRNLQVGDLVLMVEPSLSRGSWPLARISRVFPAADGRIRSAELQTASGKRYTRPAAKICFLEEEAE